MNIQFKKGILELCVLKLLYSKKMSCKEIIDTIETYFASNANTIYPLLRRLHQEKMLDIEMVNLENASKRKYYSCSYLGQKNCDKLLSEYTYFTSSVNKFLEGKL